MSASDVARQTVSIFPNYCWKIGVSKVEQGVSEDYH